MLTSTESIDPDEMQHFISVFSVCKSNRLGVSQIQRVNEKCILISISTCLMADINNMGHEETKLSCTLKRTHRIACATMLSDQCHYPVNCKFRKWPENTTNSDTRQTDGNHEEETQNTDRYNTNCSTNFSIFLLFSVADC